MTPSSPLSNSLPAKCHSWANAILFDMDNAIIIANFSFFAYLGKEMLKVVFSNERTILHALFVNDIAAQRELPYHIGTPLPKLSSTDRVNTITHRNDSVKVIELCHVVLAVRSSCRVFLGN